MFLGASWWGFLFSWLTIWWMVWAFAKGILMGRWTDGRWSAPTIQMKGLQTCKQWDHIFAFRSGMIAIYDHKPSKFSSYTERDSDKRGSTWIWEQGHNRTGISHSAWHLQLTLHFSRVSLGRSDKDILHCLLLLWVASFEHFSHLKTWIKRTKVAR